MRFDFHFHDHIFDCLFGGVSVLDIPRLHLSNLEEAKRFILGYGFDLGQQEDLEKVWDIHAQAIALMQERLLNPEEEIPALVSNRELLKDPCYLLIFASTAEHDKNQLQKWACAVLRVMHVFVHLKNDLFATFSEEIQHQVILPFRQHIYEGPLLGTYLKSDFEPEPIHLNRFEVKTLKTTASSVVKLLAKADLYALSLLDKVGVRFVTNSLFDSFRVVRFLVENNIVSFPHLMADQSNNTLFPVNLFMEVMDQVKAQQELYSVDELDQLLLKTLGAQVTRAEYRDKFNAFSSDNYRFIKFINRQLVRIPINTRKQKELSFFFPYEVQVVDYLSYVQSLSGPSAHENYKQRQTQAARDRVMQGFA